MKTRRRPWVWLVLIGIGVTAAMAPGVNPPVAQPAPAGEIDQRAVELLKRMSDYLAGLKEFTVRARHTSDEMLATGQKVQYDGISDVFVRRPDRLRSNRVGEVADLEFYYDGATMTLFGKRARLYAVSPAPATLDAMLDDVRARLDMEPPGADLLYSDPFTGLMSDVTQATYMGPSPVGRMPTHHLAFRSREVDWQIWIDEGARPLPRKYLITTKWSTGAPQHAVEFGEWNLFPQLADATFTFRPPLDAQKIEFLPRTETAPR
jgi:hypothetical protein